MEYAKCLVELNEILGHLEKEYLDKIPQDVRNGITEKMDKHYNWKYDESKELEEQNIDRKTIAMLSYLNMEYLLDDEQRKLMEEIHKVNEMKTKEKMRAKANNSLNRIKEEKTDIKRSWNLRICHLNVGIDYYTSQYDDSGVIWKYPRHDFQCAESDEPVYQ